MVKTKKNYDILIYNIILISLVIDIGGSLYLKNISFALLAVYLLLKILVNNNFKFSDIMVYLKKSIFHELKVETIVFMLSPILIFLFSIIYWRVEPREALGQITPYILWLLYPILIDLEPEVIINQFKKILYFCALIVIVTFMIIYCFHLLGRYDLVEMFTSVSSKFSLGFIGQNPAFYPIFLPNVFFRWTFLLIPGFILHVDEFNYKTLIFGAAIFMTLSTGTILFAFIGFIIKLFLMYKRGENREKIVNSIKVIVLIILIVSAFIDMKPIINPILDKFSSTNSSTSVKLLHIESIIEILKSDVYKLLFGMGLGSEFYSKALMGYTVNVEVSHFNLIRQFGIIYSMFFFYYIYYLCKMLISTDNIGKSLAIGLVCLFFAAGTNPLLISPVFFLMLVVCRGYCTTLK